MSGANALAKQADRSTAVASFVHCACMLYGHCRISLLSFPVLVPHSTFDQSLPSPTPPPVVPLAAPFNQFFLYPSIYLSSPFPRLPPFLPWSRSSLSWICPCRRRRSFSLLRRQETNRPPRAVPPLGGRAGVRICGGGGRKEGERTAIEKAAVVKGKPGGEPRRHRVML